MPHDPIQGQGHRGLEVAKMADFKAVYLLCQYTCNQKTMVNYDTQRQYINFNRTDL